ASTCSGVPLALEPAYTLTVTVVESPLSVPATPLNEGVWVERLAPLAGEVNDTSGAVVSIVQVALAGVGSTVPSVFVARTRKLCWPSARPLTTAGLVQAVNVAASSEHANVACGSSDVNAKLALAEQLGSAGPDVIVVSGAAVLMVKVLALLDPV